MSAAARRRRAAKKANPYSNALPGVLRMPAGCMVRCPDCRSRCLNDDDDGKHWFPCDH